MGRSMKRCGWIVGVEHYREIRCGKPAVLLVDRRSHGLLLVCAEHLNSAELYRDVKRNRWIWYPLADGQPAA